mgnify:CR=1 FL=1
MRTSKFDPEEVLKMAVFRRWVPEPVAQEHNGKKLYGLFLGDLPPKTTAREIFEWFGPSRLGLACTKPRYPEKQRPEWSRRVSGSKRKKNASSASR